MSDFWVKKSYEDYNSSSSFRGDVSIARFQLRFVGSRWVVIDDVFDDVASIFDSSVPLMFGEYEAAYLALYRFAKEYEKAGLDVPDLEIVAIDFRGCNRYCRRFNDRDIETFGKKYHLSQMSKKE